MQQSEKLTLANEYRVAVTCGRFMRMRFTLASGIFLLAEFTHSAMIGQYW